MNVTYLVLLTQLWLIYEVMSLKATNKLRFGRIESDIESEKETRKRRNESFDARLHAVETKS